MSCHYFGFSTRNFRLDSEELDEFQRKTDIMVRQQDVDAIEAVERRLESAATVQRGLLAKSHGPAAKVRRRIDALLQVEAAA